jgi:hypothetical protein
MTANNSQSPAKGKTGRGVELVLWPTALFFVGLFALFIAERAISKDSLQRVCDGLAMLLLLGSVVGFAARRSSAQDPADKTAQGRLLLSSLVSTLGVSLYLLFAAKTPGLNSALHSALEKNYEKVSSMVAVAWPAMLMLGAIPVAFITQALSSMTDGQGRAEAIEPQRVRYSTQSGLSLALVVVFVGAINYVASERNVKLEYARFRSTRPSEVTRKVVQNLSRPIRATLFYPTGNEVREQIQPYFDELAAQSDRFKVEVLDHALEPTRARELSATGNGLVVLSALDDKGASTQRETLNLGVTIELAQNNLTTLDSQVQKRLLTLSRPGRIAYFTSGHGERSFDGGALDLQKDDLRAPVGFLRTMLMNLGYEVRQLNVGNGLATKVPADAGMVLIAGPTEHFLPEEAAALQQYLFDGGHVFLMLDPTSETAANDLASVLKSVGLKYHPQLLCHDEVYAVRTHKAADKANIVSTSFSSHVSVTTLSQNSGRAGVILPKTGWFERDGAPPAGVQLDFPLRSMPKTYIDANNNFTFDPGEKQQVFEVSAVAQKTLDSGSKDPKDPKAKRELRLSALGSVDAVSDLGMFNRANGALAQDTVKWLMNDEAIVGETVQETDLPIMHTKDQDKLWFYSTIIAAPLLVLLAGFGYLSWVRRRRAA